MATARLRFASPSHKRTLPVHANRKRSRTHSHAPGPHARPQSWLKASWQLTPRDVESPHSSDGSTHAPGTLMQDFEKLGVFYLGSQYDQAAKKADPDPLILYDSKDLVTHAVCVGMTGSGKTGLCLALLEEAAIDDIPALIIDPKGDLSNLLLTVPDLKGSDCQPWINTDDAQEGRRRPGGVRPAAGRSLEEGTRLHRPDRRADPDAEAEGRLRHLHAGLERRRPRLDPAVVRGPARISSRRLRAPPRTGQHHGHQPARAPQHRGGSGLVEGAHPPVDDPGDRVEGGQEPRPAVDHLADPDAGREPDRRARSRDVLPVEGAVRSVDAVQQPARVAELRVVDVRRAARHRLHALHEGREAADGDLLDRPPQRHRADVLRLPLLQPGSRLDAPTARHHEPARPHLHGRDLRLLPAGQEPADEDADADDAEAGPRVRRRHDPRHAEPGRHRLQGARQLRHLVSRPFAK